MLEDQQASPRTRASAIDHFAAEEQNTSEEVISIDDNSDNSTIDGVVHLNILKVQLQHLSLIQLKHIMKQSYARF